MNPATLPGLRAELMCPPCVGLAGDTAGAVKKFRHDGASCEVYGAHAVGLASRGSNGPQRPRKPWRNFSRSSGVIRCQRSAIRRRRSEEHTSELQSLAYLVCRLL